MIKGYLTTLEFAEEFFKRCSTLKPDTRETRIQLWEQMVQELKGIRMNETDLRKYVRNKRIVQVRKPNETKE